MAALTPTKVLIGALLLTCAGLAATDHVQIAYQWLQSQGSESEPAPGPISLNVVNPGDGRMAVPQAGVDSATTAEAVTAPGSSIAAQLVPALPAPAPASPAASSAQDTPLAAGTASGTVQAPQPAQALASPPLQSPAQASASGQIAAPGAASPASKQQPTGLPGALAGSP